MTQQSIFELELPDDIKDVLRFNGIDGHLLAMVSDEPPIYLVQLSTVEYAVLGPYIDVSRGERSEPTVITASPSASLALTPLNSLMVVLKIISPETAGVVKDIESEEVYPVLQETPYLRFYAKNQEDSLHPGAKSVGHLLPWDTFSFSVAGYNNFSEITLLPGGPFPAGRPSMQ